ncbi:TonB-dependent receptor [Altericroceibacterium endophyticum]|uniref:TonB-dependent receptor n=1 Tax=Altericroceibacterium endophyticum TaxID=1808508 RepID=A0A6I4T9B0_9SPHN|nr:TonB-dependent receptor [Altericroceibacterium endophyticum]MXO66741.1 TonB-dependent receptor [Altericroceibacterium endophyticum]
MTIDTYRIAACVLVAATASTPVMAQDPAATRDGPRDVLRDRTIIVTAQKRSQTLDDIPQSISVVGGDTLEVQQANSLVDYTALVPGLTLEQSDPGNSRIVLRGINTGGASPTAAVYVDETPFSPSTGQSNGAVMSGDFDTFDIERIEILRGPQGTLYGANSLGGLIKFVTVAPKLGEFEGRVRAGAEFTKGGEMGWNANGVINLPLGDIAALRASGYYRKTGGFIDTVGIDREDANDHDSYGGRASLLIEPDDAVSVRLTAIVQNIRANSRGTFDADPVTLEPLAIDPNTGASTGGRLTRSEFYPEKNNVDYRLYNATIDWDLGPVSLTSATSYSTLDQAEVYDVTYQLAGLADSIYGGPDTDPLGFTFPGMAGQEKFTQELRLQSAPGNRFEWLIGAYYTWEDGSLDQAYLPFDIGTGKAIDPSMTLPAGPNGEGVLFTDFLKADVGAKYDEYAGFGSVTFHVTPRFDITAGGRYSHNKQTSRIVFDGVYQFLVGEPAPDVQNGASNEDVFTWSVSPRFDLSDDAMVYARVAKGYRPGGPNVVPPGAGPNFPRQFDSDTLISYEAGMRASTPDGLLSIDASAYYLDWSDIQVLVVYETAVGPIGGDGNGDSATSKGVELSATLRPLRGFDVALNLAYNDAKLDEDLPAGNGGYAGDRLPYAPEWTGGVSADYEWTLTGDSTAFVGGTLQFTGEQATAFDDAYQTTFGERLTLDSYARIDLRAGVRLDRFDISLYAKNLADSRGLTSASSFGSRPGTAVLAAPIRPRTFGINVGADF